MNSLRSALRSHASGFYVRSLVFIGLAGGLLLGLTGPAQAQELGTARLQIAGTRLAVSPATQTVPLETATLVETHLEGYDPALGVLPEDLRVVADFVGPGLEGGLRLESYPNEPLRVPALRTKGEYFLENIRLLQGEELLTYAEPRTASVLATQILITSVSTRALTEDEIRNYGIVIGDDSRQAINLTFAFGFEGRELEYSMPVVFRHFGPEDWGRPAEMEVPHYSGRTVALGRFQPPRPVPFKVAIQREQVEERIPFDGCPFDQEPCRMLEPPEPPMVGVVFFPTEMSLLHQFFSVVLMVQNGALDGDPLTISDLTARIQVPSGLRQASTEPPTPLGVPVPVRVPGADGEVGTSDDLTILVAQATGQAEFLVEGLQQGTHIVDFEMEGMLHGLPEGPQRITGAAQGAVTVRDPTLSATVSHPTVVNENAPYSTFFTVTNLGNQPVNGIQITLPPSGLAGTRLADGEVNTKDLGSLLPGESASAEFEMVALLSGRLVATSTRAGSGVSPFFEFSVGVGNGIPLAPESLALPQDVDSLPPELLDPAKRILGLAHALSTAPWELVRDKPQITRRDVDERAYRLVEAGRLHDLGEPLFETGATLLTEWAGARDASWDWDELRRLVDPALELAEYVGATMQVTEPDADSALERFASTTYAHQPWLALARYGEIEVASRVSGKSSRGFLGDAVRELPFTELVPLGSAEMALIAHPEDEGHRVIVRRQASGGVDLRLILPSESGGDMRSISWQAVSLDAGGSAWVDVIGDGSSFQLQVDGDADGVAEYQIPGTEQSLLPRPFEALVARQNKDVDPSGHVVDVLFSRDVALRSLIPRDPERFQIPGRESNGGITPTEQSVGGGILGIPQVDNPFEGMSNPRVVRVVFNNPLAPDQQHDLTLGDLESASGELLTSQTLTVETTVDQPGIRLEGTVIDSYGKPLPGARVTLYESDVSGVGPLGACSAHATAVTLSDSQGRYAFDYVRQTACSDVFGVIALAPGEPRWGEAKGRVRFVGQTQELDIVMVGRAIVEGRVTYEDGSAPEGLRVTAYNPLHGEGRAAWTDETGNYRMAEVVVGTVQLTAWDELGNRVFQTIEVPTAGARVERDLVLIRRQEGQTTGTVRGRVVSHTTSEPVSDAYVALYIDQQLIATHRSAHDGTFDFGTVPTGIVELQAFDGLTGLEGARLFTELQPDQVIDEELRLTNDRGSIVGRVLRVAVDGSQTPVSDAIVWVHGLPENTRTDSEGNYRLDDVVLGTHRVEAADLVANESVAQRVTLDTSGGEARADLYFREENTLTRGAVTGTVLGRDGQPVSGATVHLSGGYWSVRWVHSATTDAAGRFRIEDVTPRTFAVHAHRGDDGGIAWGEVQFPGDVDDVTVQFAGGLLRGRTFYTDAQALEVPVVSTIYYRHVEVVPDWDLVAVGKDWRQLVTESDGTFEVPVLNGPFEIIAHNSFHGSKRFSGFFDQFAEEVEIEFDRNGSISGTVLLHDGITPAVGADVTLKGGEITDFTMQTDENGRFFFDLLKKGSYQLTAIHEPGAVFRTQRIWARLEESGDELDVEIVLPKQGTVQGWVEDADGARVAAAVIELSERSFPWRKIRQTTDGEGNYLFDNIFEGNVSLTAQAPELGGLGATALGEITDEGQELHTLLVLEGVGTVLGTIWSPETGEGVANARVRLERRHSSGDFFGATTSELDGSFSFDQLPLGFYRVSVFDPTTGRRGRGEDVEVTHHGHERLGDVTLEVRGTVDGHIYDPPSNVPVPGATIRLKSQGLKWFTVYSSASVDGYFTFEGIPEGPFRVSSVVDGRKAENSGEIVEEDEVVTRDLYLQAFATIQGIVLGPKAADGSPGPPMDNVNITVERGSTVVAAGTENPFAFDRMLPGIAVVEATEEGVERSVTDRVRIEEGAEHEVELVMRAMGSATVQVESSTGDPVPYAQIRLTNNFKTDTDAVASTAGGKRRHFDKTADENGRASFEGLLEGGLYATVEDPSTGLRGSAGELLTYEGQEVAIEVALQPSGTIRGTVFLSDGTTPGVGIAVALRLGHAWQLIETDESGFFEFTSVPLLAFDLEAQDPTGPGSFATSNALQSDQEVQDYTIVLDDEDPFVVSMTPESMSRDLPLDTQVVLRFNEPMAACTHCNSWFAFERVQGGNVSFQVIWSEDDSVATLIPNQPLASATTYRVRLRPDAVDRAGRIVDPLFVGGLTTADVVPPRVIDTEPQPDAVQVPVTSGITIQFSEPVDVDSLSGAFQVTDLTTGQPITVTTLVRLDETGVVLTPVSDFELDREIEVRVTGVADPAGNVEAEPFVMTFWTPDVTVPEIQWLRPSIHQTFTSGDVVDFEVRVTDNQGTARVRFEFDEWTSDWLPAEVDPGSPGQPTEEIFTAQLPAPIRHAGGDVVVRTVAEDVWGNVAQSEQTLRLEPLSNQVAPTVGASCPADADFVVPGQPLTTTLAVVDDLGLESAWLEVDGQLVDVVAPVLVADSPVADTTVDLSWTPDVQATAGQVFSLEFFARDFAGNVTSRQLTAQVPGAPVTLAGDPLAGSALYLAAGEHVSAGDLYVDEVVVLDGASWTTEATDFLSATTRVEIQCGGVATLAEVDAPTVRVERGGVLRTPRIEPLRITAELFEVEEDGLVDGAGRGYYGHRELYAPDPQYAPPGVEQAILDGASHGGRGGREGNDSNQPTYGSVYVPALAGAGGYRSNSTHAGRGGNGGGALDVRSDRVILDGRVDVRGHHGGETETEFLHPGSGGAGGSVLLDTAELSGVGWIGAAGGDGAGGSGAGGGRIAIHAEQLNGFDPAQQTNAHGGYRDLLAGRAYAGPGTIFVRTDQSTYGRLWIQNRTEAGEILATGRIDFPELGTGAVAASQVEGANRWIFGSEEFDVAWLGAWMQLEDGAGADLGTYRVLQLDGLRVLLEGGAPASGASTFQGMYLFDELHSTSADLHHSDPLRISGELSLSGEIDVREALDVGSLTVGAEAQITYYAPWNVSGDVLIRSGAVIRPNDRESVEITAGGRLDLEADAWIDVDARGYLSNEAPEGVEPNSSGTGGGSHGGHPWDSTMPDVYDSVYLPNLPGIGGGSDNGYVLLQSEGGGVVVLQADEMTLDGEVTARSRRHVVEGAGGTIRLHSRLLSGSGMLHAGPPEGARHGGGGRIAIWADHLMGFDPVHQSRAWGGGTSTDQNGAAHAAAGTVLVHTAESSHGRLIIDNGVYETGQTRFTPTPTVLPVLGSGPTMAAVAEGLDLRLDLGTPARWRWAGAYVELLDTGGALLGEFRVIEPDGNTILVADAGSLASQVASYRGVYRFDRIDLLRGAQLDWPDATSLDEMVIGSETLISAPIEARSIRLTSDAVLRPSGRHPIELRADESIVIEAGAVIDVSLMGFEGFLQHGTAPVDILAAGVDSAGSHGGRGLGNEPGEVFGSVYYPSQAGGSGTRNAHGGGVIVLDAPSVQLDGTLLAVGSPHNWQGAGGSVRIEAGILSGSGRVDASADHDSYQRAAGGGRVALLVDQLVGFDPETQVEATAALNTDNFLPTGATGTIFVRDASSTNGRLIVDNRPLEERNAVGIDLRKAFQTELPALGEGTPAAAVANGADLLVDLGAAPKLRWHKAWIELLDDSDSSLGVFQVGALEGNSLRVNGAASFAASVARYRGTYRFDRVDVRGGAGLQSFDPTHADLVDLAGDVEFGGPWTAGEYIIRRDAQIWPVDYEPIELRADTSITVEDGAVLSAVGRSLYDGHVGAPSRAPENVAPGSTNYGAHGGFSGDADGELYGSVYFPRYGGGSGSGWSRGGGVIRLVAPTVQIDGLVDASSTISRSAAGTVAIDADHLLGSGQILASGPTNSGGGRVALRATTTLTFDPSTQASAAGGPYNSSVRGGVGTIYVHGPNSVWGDLLLDNEQAGLTHQHNQPYTYLPRVGAGTVGVVEVDADDPSNVWIEPSATGLVFDLGVEGMWLRTAGGDFRILAEDGSRRRILLEDGAGLIQVGDSYSGLYRFDSATVRLGSYLRIDDESEVGVWSVDEHSAVEASSLALDVVVSGAGSATEGVSYSLSATFTDQETGQVHTATADWGDGVVDPLSVVDGDSGSVSGGHIWADDGTYTVVVCVRDDDGREGCDSLDVTVSNAVPVVTVAEAALATDEGLTLVLADSSFTDGAGDVHTASVDWGDSTSDAASVAFDGGVGTVPGVSHVYSDDGNYQIEVCVRDDEGAEGCDTIAVTVGNVAPQVIAAAGTVALDGVSEKELATYADGGTNDTHSATIDWADGTAVTVGTVVVTGPGQGQVLGDHAYATGGVYDVQVCVVDDSSDSSCAITQVSSADSVPPTVSVAGVNSSYSAGETLTATITTTDAVGVERVEVTFDGAITVLTDGGPVFVYQTQVDPTVTTPRDTALEVVAYDYSGNASTTYSQSVLLGVDLPPDLTLTVTPERIDGRYVAGEGLTFVAEATDNVSVSSLTIDVDGQVTAGTSPLTVDWTAPSVSQSTPVVVTATATDNNGNSSTETLNLQVDPSSNGIPPEVAFSCPTDGAMLPSAYDLPLQLTATDDEGVRQVELFFDDDTTPFAVATPSSAGTLSFDVSETATLPTVSGAPQTVRLRAVVTDAAANSTTSEITVEVVEAVDLATDGSNDWAALASAVGVLRSGILEIDQPRTLGGLIVLDGATVTHPPASVGAETALDLSVGGSVYVACGAALDVTAMGYRPNETYPGETTSANGSGGSHLGVGGQFANSPPGSTYGSVYYPTEPGAGGDHAGWGLAGGGVVLVEASEMVIDGAIRANGDSRPTGGYRAGAGGSIWLDVSGDLSGAGSIEANGGEVPGGYGAGGGGTVAVYHGSSESDPVSDLLARGGGAKYAGGAGTVYAHGPGSTYGELTLDVGSVDGITDLPSLGSGTAQTGSSGTRLETDLPSIQPYFVGHWVEIYDASGAWEGTWRVESIDGAAAVLLETGATVDVGDTWQGVYRFDRIEMLGDLELRSDDPIRVSDEHVIHGTVEADLINGHDLVLRSGSTLTHRPTTDSSSVQRLEISLSGRLTIESGAAIDVSAKGYRPNQTYPGETGSANGSGGSHLGLGGQFASSLPGSTYGSVYFPSEPGAGGQNSGVGLAGGGVVLVEAAELVVDGAIRANGDSRPTGGYRGGAGGSVWLDVSGDVSGTGSIEANGGEVPGGYGAGGGGGIAVYHGSSGPSLVSELLARGGAANYAGGVGAVYLHGPSSTYGDLILDAGAVVDGITDLPSLGTGTAQAGSSGTRLETDLSSIQPYFVGHWVEIYNASGALEGTWRVESIDGSAVVLESGATVDAGDGWQGVYRFDDMEVLGDLELRSADPIRVSGEQAIDGTVETDRITGHDLLLRSGSTLTHRATTDSSNAQRLEILLTGRLMIESGAAIDVSGKGYRPNQTHPGETTSANGSGGSHLGRGGQFATSLPGSTYGSVYYPTEPGAGGQNGGVGLAGGGVVLVEAGELVVDGAILANGDSQPTGGYRGGAGGSIWLDVTGQVSGAGSIEANGGEVPGGYGAGGGGAVAVYHGGIDTGLTSRLMTLGGAEKYGAGAGVVYLFGPTSTYGDLIVDSADVVGNWTELPALGAGAAQVGSGADVLVTDLATPVQTYFVGHWVEIYDGATGALEGTYRIAEILPGGLSVRLAANGPDTPAVDPDDLWQGVYLFDDLLLTGDALGFTSDDPVIATGTQTIRGAVTTERIVGGDLTLDTDALLTHPLEDGASRGLDIRLTGDLTLASGAAIDVSGQGYANSSTHGAATLPGAGGGGSHLGLGGHAPGTSYGSVTEPWEHGGGGENSTTYGGFGGGRVRIVATDLTFVDSTSAIRANGLSTVHVNTRGGAGGSIWIDLSGLLTGDGAIEAAGGDAGASGYGSGGGGAVAIYHQGSSGTALSLAAAWGGVTPDIGGAGTLYVHGPTSTEGDLIVRSAGSAGRDTVLPSLGQGSAGVGSSGATLVTGLPGPIPDYFLGHFVEISTAAGTVKGTFPIQSIDGATLTLADDDGVPPSVAETDTWRGVYRFDSVTVDDATLSSSDAIFESGTEIVP